jgi:DNA-binding response OmpR family regulator
MSTVLVVDDDEDIRFFLRTALEAEGFEVNEAASGEEALDLLVVNGNDCVLLDLRMPGLSGWDILAWLREQGRLGTLPVVVHSAHADDRTASAVLAAGARAFLPKPFSVAGLLGTVAAALHAA